MIVDTVILDSDMREQISDVHAIGERLTRAEVFREYIDRQWETFDYMGREFDWKSVSRDLQANIENIRTYI